MADQAIRAEGINLFEKGLWKEAVEKFGEYIDLLLVDREIDGRLVIGYSTRAQVFLQLEKYADALEDTENALNLYPQHLESLVRKAKALEGLKLFRQAAAVYSYLFDRGDIREDHARAIQHSLQVAIMKDRQTRLGQFDDIEDWWESRKGKLEDYVGPVEVRRVSGMDRGLFATRDVYPGELLFVATPIIAVQHPHVRTQYSEVYSSLIRGVEKRVTHALQNLKDFSQAQLLVQLDVLAGPYPAGPLSRDAPSMTYFTPVNALAPHLRRLTAEDVQHPRFRTEFNMDTLLQMIRCRANTWVGMETDVDVTGIYCLPSLINHSCLPNVSVTCQSSVIQPVIPFFCRASRRIREGDELFSSYRGEAIPIDVRGDISPNTRCRCARCLLEERLLKGSPQVRQLEQTCKRLWRDKQRARLVWALEEERSEVRNECIQSISLLGELFTFDSKLRGLTTTEKDWVRAAFIRFYRLLQEPALALSPRSAENDHLYQLQMIVEAVRVLRTIDPASLSAMGMSSEAVRQSSAWFIGEHTHASSEISKLEAKLYMEGLEIARLIYGPQVKQEVVRQFFLYGMPPENICDDRF